MEFVTPLQRTGNVEWAFLRDPDGNLVELIDLKVLRPALKAVGGLLGTSLKRGKYCGLLPRTAVGGTGRLSP